MKLRIAYGRRVHRYESDARTVGEVAKLFAKSRCIPGDGFTLAVADYGELPKWTATRQYLRDNDKATLVPL